MAGVLAAFEPGAAAGQERHAVEAFGEGEAGELVFAAAGETPGEILLILGEDVDRVHCSVFEDGHARQVSGQAPHHKGRRERYGIE